MDMMKKLILAVLVLAAAGLVYLYMRPVPKLTAVKAKVTTPKPQSVGLPWPSHGQAAVGAAGYGLLASHGDQKPVPIASVAKTITAYAVLSQRPFTPGTQGPTITLDSTDLGYFNYYYTHVGSDTNVAVGEKISEYQALQSLLLPSSNNMADSLARWAFGSITAYMDYANRMVERLGMTHTTVGSTNGFNDKTLSTANDLVKLGGLVLKSPVMATIVSQQSAKIPVEGTVSNVNDLVGSYGINGIKTGNTTKAGGCYLFSSKQTVAGQPVELIGAVLDQPDLTDALKAAPPLISSADKGFKQTAVIKKGQSLGYYQAPWGAKADITAQEDVNLLAWQGLPVKIKDSPGTITAPAASGSTVGSIVALSGSFYSSVPLNLKQNLPAPSFWWRIFHL